MGFQISAYPQSSYREFFDANGEHSGAGWDTVARIALHMMAMVHMEEDGFHFFNAIGATDRSNDRIWTVTRNQFRRGFLDAAYMVPKLPENIENDRKQRVLDFFSACYEYCDSNKLGELTVWVG